MYKKIYHINKLHISDNSGGSDDFYSVSSPYKQDDIYDDFYTKNPGLTFEQYSFQYYSMHQYINKNITLKLIDSNEVSGKLIKLTLSEAILESNDRITHVHLSKISYYSVTSE